MRIKRKAFSLVELMVAVSILSIGIVGVGRSFLNAISGIGYCQNLVSKTWFLDDVMNNLEQFARDQEGFNKEKEEITTFFNDKIKEAREKGIGELTWETDQVLDQKHLVKLILNIKWAESGREKNEDLVALLPVKE